MEESNTFYNASNEYMTLKRLIESHPNIKIYVTVGFLSSFAYYINEILIAHLDNHLNIKNVLYIPDAPHNLNEVDISTIAYNTSNDYNHLLFFDALHMISNTNIIKYNVDNLDNLEYIIINFSDDDIDNIHSNIFNLDKNIKVFRYNNIQYYNTVNTKEHKNQIYNNPNIKYIYVVPNTIDWLFYRINTIKRCFNNLFFINDNSQIINDITTLNNNLFSSSFYHKLYKSTNIKNYNGIEFMFHILHNLNKYNHLLTSNPSNTRILQLISRLDITPELINNYKKMLSYVKTQRGITILQHNYTLSTSILTDLFSKLNIPYIDNLRIHFLELNNSIFIEGDSRQYLQNIENIPLSMHNIKYRKIKIPPPANIYMEGNNVYIEGKYNRSYATNETTKYKEQIINKEKYENDVKQFKKNVIKIAYNNNSNNNLNINYF